MDEEGKVGMELWKVMFRPTVVRGASLKVWRHGYEHNNNHRSFDFSRYDLSCRIG